MSKVLFINGSPNAQGCTYTALREVEKSLNKNGVETEVFQIGRDPVHGCTGCGGCGRNGKCVFDDGVNRKEGDSYFQFNELLSLGFKNIRLGPTLPAFLSPGVASVLVKSFGIKGITVPENDIRDMMTGH